jgi:hypothetical protein
MSEIFCIAKFVEENKLLDIGNLETYPNNFDTQNIDCDNIIENRRIVEETKYKDEMKTVFEEPYILCAIGKYRSQMVFENELAIEVVKRNHMSISSNLAASRRSFDKLSNFKESLRNC